MKNLDNKKNIEKLDESQMLKSIGWLYKQCQQVWDDSKDIHIPSSYKNINKIVLNGMGGSALGTDIIKALYSDSMRVPLEITRSYFIPKYVDKNTLFIASSYSGNTEEVVATVLPAIKRGAKVLIISGGGKLAQLKDKYNLPGYIFHPQYNPSNQPRIGLGYMIFGQFVLFKKLGLINLSDARAKQIIAFSQKTFKKFDAGVGTKKNIAKKIAHELHGKFTLIFSAEHLSGNAHVFANQTNENAKNFSAYYLLSEMNHHLLEGVRFPKSNPRNVHGVLFESSLYYQRNQTRFSITKDILKKNKIGYSVYHCRATDTILQSFETLIVGSCISFYLAMLNNIDPSPIPWVDYFKEELVK